MSNQKQSRRGFAKTVAAGMAAATLDAFNADGSRRVLAGTLGSAGEGTGANVSATGGFLESRHVSVP